jgi:hypothetical protein
MYTMTVNEPAAEEIAVRYLEQAVKSSELLTHFTAALLTAKGIASLVLSITASGDAKDQQLFAHNKETLQQMWQLVGQMIDAMEPDHLRELHERLLQADPPSGRDVLH